MKHLSLLRYLIISCLAMPFTLDISHAGGSSEVSSRFSSSPGGVILEGVAVGMEAPSTLGFDSKSGMFTINSTMQYRCPVPWAEWLILLDSIRQDDRVGVSLTMGMEVITYGGLPSRCKVTEALITADKLLADICFGTSRVIDDVRLPDGFRPAKIEGRNGVIACFGIANIIFVKENDEYRRKDFDLQVFLLAASKERAADGGHILDLEATEALEKSFDQTNIEHLQANRGEYFKIPILAKAAAYAEAAAFARYLRESGFDLAAMHAAMSARRAAGVLQASSGTVSAPSTK